MRARVVRRSFQRPGRIVPRFAKHLRGRSVTLRPGQAIARHSTGTREEMLVALAGRLTLELEDASRAPARIALSEGQCAFLPHATRHRVVNASGRPARYLYLTA